MPGAREPVVIGSFPNSGEANLARNRLREAGIPAEIADDITADANWYMIGAIHNVKLLIPADRLDEAKSILADKVTSAEVEFAAKHWLQQPETDEPSEEQLTLRESNARRAYIGAIAGLGFWPLQFYVFWVLTRVYVSNDSLGPKYRRRAWIALAFNLPIVLIQCVYLRLLWRELVDSIL